MSSYEKSVERLAEGLASRSSVAVGFETGLLVLLAVLALLGNSSALIVLYKTPRLRNVTSYYLVTLAISDVISSTIVMPIAVGNSAVGRDIFGDAACKVIGFIGYTLVFGSLQTTTLIAVNRFFCVVKPRIYRKFFKAKPALLMIVGAWVFSITNVAIVILSGMARFEFFPGRYVCNLAFTGILTERIFLAISQLMFTVFPLGIVTICYWKVYKTVKTHNETVAATLNQGPARNRTLSKEETQVTKSVLALVCGFVVCWFPCSSIAHVAAYVDIPRGLEMTFIYLAFLSSAINPILYNVFNKPFRREFLKVFRLNGRIGTRINVMGQATATTSTNRGAAQNLSTATKDTRDS